MPTTLPSHTAMLTGSHPSRFGVNSNWHIVPEEATTLAEVLADAGFDTAAFVSAVPLDPETGLLQGFSTFGSDRGEKHSAKADRTVDLALDWLDAHQAERGDERLFLFVHLWDPHAPYGPPDEYRESWDVPVGRTPKTSGFFPDGEPITAEAIAEASNAYDAEIAYVDSAVGRLLDELERRGLRQDTVVALTSDHGESFDELAESHGYAFDHGEFLYAHQLHVPLLIDAPDLPGPVVHERPVSLVDLMPTLLDLLGVPVPADLDSTSLGPIMAGTGEAATPVLASRRAFVQQGHPELGGKARSIIWERYQYVAAEGVPDELYDLEDDPQEHRNLAQARQDVLESLSRQLAALRELHLRVGRVGDLSSDPERDRALQELGYTR